MSPRCVKLTPAYEKADPPTLKRGQRDFDLLRESTLTTRPGEPTLSFPAERDGYGRDVETA